MSFAAIGAVIVGSAIVSSNNRAASETAADAAIQGQETAVDEMTAAVGRANDILDQYGEEGLAQYTEQMQSAFDKVITKYQDSADSLSEAAKASTQTLIDAATQVRDTSTKAIGEMKDTELQGATDIATANRNALTRATNRFMTQRGTTRSDFNPYLTAGENAINQLNDYITGKKSLNDTLANDAGYQFTVAEGNKALDRSQIGRRLSGRAIKESMRYNQGLGATQSNNVLNRLMTIANQGQGATNALSGYEAGSTGNLANLDLTRGATNAQELQTKMEAVLRAKGATTDQINYATNRIAELDAAGQLQLGTIDAQLNDAIAKTGLAIDTNVADVTRQTGENIATSKANNELAVGSAASGAAINTGNIIGQNAVNQATANNDFINSLLTAGMFAYGRNQNQPATTTPSTNVNALAGNGANFDASWYN